jgi:hypothetical protein
MASKTESTEAPRSEECEVGHANADGVEGHDEVLVDG